MEIDHATQMTAMQNRLIAMKTAQTNRLHHKPNNGWQKRTPPQEQRPPNHLETNNLVDHQVIPYCRPCGEFHEESTCPTFIQICEGEAPRTKNEQINMFSQKYNVSMNDWMELMDHSKDVNCMVNNVDKVIEIYGPKPTPRQISEMAKYKGIAYQRRGFQNQDRPQTNISKVHFPPKENILPSNTDLNIDLGGWINNAKLLVPIAKLVKIPAQKDKLLKAIEEHSPNSFVSRNSKKSREKQIVEAYQDALVILQNIDRGNEENAPFFITLIMNDHLLHNCMLDSGASSSVMTKKVMEQLNLRISRPYHNICAMDSKVVEVHGLIKDLQVHLVVFPDIQIIMDIVVIDVPDAWGMLLSRKWVADWVVVYKWIYLMLLFPLLMELWLD